MTHGTPAQDKKIDKCIKSDDWKDKKNPRTGKPFATGERTAICKSKVMKSDFVEVKGEWYYVSLAQALCQSLIVPIEMPKKETDPSISSHTFNHEIFIVDDEDGVFDSIETESAKLTYEQRKALKDSAFCLVYNERGKSGKMIKRRRFPAQDASHVRNGLARLPQAKLTPTQRAKVRSCLVKRAKTYGIKVSSAGFDGELFGHFPLTAFTDEDELNEIKSFMEKLAIEAHDSESDLIPVLVGLEGQQAMNPWTGEIYTITAEFFESIYKDYKGKFFYPGHENKFNVQARLAKIIESDLRKVVIKGKELLAMIHFISPRSWGVQMDIENGYYSDVSLDALNSKFSSDDPLLVVGGDALGVAFVAGLPEMKGCPACKVAHPVGASCVTYSSPSGTSEAEVPGHKKDKEVINLAEKDKKKNDGESQKPPVDPPPPASGQDGVSAGELPQNTELEARIEFLENKDALSALAKRLEMDSSIFMPIISSQSTIETRLKSLEALVAKVEEDKKKIIKSKVTKDPKESASGTDPKGGSAGKTVDGWGLTQAQIDEADAILAGVEAELTDEVGANLGKKPDDDEDKED